MIKDIKRSRIILDLDKLLSESKLFVLNDGLAHVCKGGDFRVTLFRIDSERGRLAIVEDSFIEFEELGYYMIKEIKLQRLKEEINRYLSSLYHIQNKYNDLLYSNMRLTINISHLDNIVKINKNNLEETLKFGNDYELFIAILQDRYKTKKYIIMFI